MTEQTAQDDAERDEEDQSEYGRNEKSTQSSRVVYSIPGAGSPTGCKVKTGVPLGQRFSKDQKIWLAWSEHANQHGHPVGPGVAQVSDLVSAHGILNHLVIGLKPGTRYHAFLSRTDPSGDPDWFGDPIRFTSFPTHATRQRPAVLRWSYGCCQFFFDHRDQPVDAAGKPLQTVWTDLNDFRPDILWDTGDFHYQGGNKSGRYGDLLDWLSWARMYWAQLDGLREMRKARATVITNVLCDDHDFSANDGQSIVPPQPPLTGRGPARQIQMGSMQRVLPMYELVDTRPIFERRGLYGSYLLTPQVRVIILDAESSDRSYGFDVDGPRKTFLGKAQTDWLEALLKDVVTLNIVVCGKSWIGNTVKNVTNPSSDKVWAYGRWRDDFAAFLHRWNTTPGNKPINIVHLGGDRHKIGYIRRQDNIWGHFPCYLGSGWSAHHLHEMAGEDRYTVLYGGHKAAGEKWLTMQYLRGTVTDGGSAGVTFKGSLRYLLPAEPRPRYQWKMGTLIEKEDHWDAV